MAVHPAVGDETEQVKRRPARLPARVDERPVLEEGTRLDVVVDPDEILAHDPPRPQVGVPDLGVPHLPVRQADRLARGVKPGVRVVGPEAVDAACRPGRRRTHPGPGAG